jgi:hypothetical protein
MAKNRRLLVAAKIPIMPNTTATVAARAVTLSVDRAVANIIIPMISVQSPTRKSQRTQSGTNENSIMPTITIAAPIQPLREENFASKPMNTARVIKNAGPKIKALV